MKSGYGDLIDLTYTIHGFSPEEMFCQDPEYEKKTVLFIWNYRVKQDGVCGTTGTDHAKYSESGCDRMPIHEIDQIPVIIGKYLAIPFSATIRACFNSRAEGYHILFKEYFTGLFNFNKLAINQVLSYHNYCVGAVPLRSGTMIPKMACTG